VFTDYQRLISDGVDAKKKKSEYGATEGQKKKAMFAEL
jgi:hypothetical protein